MSADYAIRAARASELEALSAIERRAAELFRGVGLAWVTELPLMPISLLEAGRLYDLLWVVERGGVPVAFLLASVVDRELHIEELDVDPAHQRRGIGRALIERAAREGRARGLRSMTLLTFRDVPWNAPFYASAGFVAIDLHAMGPELTAKAEVDATRMRASSRVAMRRTLD
jgi:GNAT superfamily N-acetyltransferase